MNTDKAKRVLSVLCAAVLFGLALLSSPRITSAQAKADSPSRIDLNKASAEQLDTLPEVGPKLAKAIVAFREKSGPFRRVEDLLAVPGISKRRLEKIRPFVFVAEEKKAKA